MSWRYVLNSYAERFNVVKCPRSHDELTLATTYFGHDLTDFGHGQFWAFSRLRRGGNRAREWGGPRLGGQRGGGRRVEGWGPKPRKRVGGRRVGGPKFRAFFSFSRPHFHFFFSLIFFSLSGCLLVSFFLSLGLLVSFFSLWGSSRAPSGLQAAGVPQDSPRAKTSTFEGPDRPKHHQNSTRRSPEREKK